MRSGCVLDSAAWLHAQPKVQGRHIMVLYCFMTSPCLFTPWLMKKETIISPATAPLKRYGWISSSFSWQIQYLTFFGGEKSVLTPHVFTIFDTWNTWTSYISMFSACLMVKPVDSPFFHHIWWVFMATHSRSRGHPWPSVACRSCCPTAVLSWHFRGRHLARDHGTHQLLI